jgi:hypothetical protein
MTSWRGKRLLTLSQRPNQYISEVKSSGQRGFVPVTSVTIDQ